jgi:two-component system cell cycle sensor histidine kinase/response regulator CckA
MTIDAIMNDFPHGFLLVDRERRICYANPHARQEFEGPKGLLLGESIGNLIPGINGDLIDRTFEGEVNFRTEETFKLFRVECYPVRYNEAAYAGIILTSIADKRVQSKEEIQKHKMESIGMLAGGIAHDFNNLLTGILGYASLLKTSLPEEGKLSRYAKIIETSAQRAATLTGHLLNFVRRGKESPHGVNLNALLADVLFLLKEGMSNITVKKDLDERIPAIRGGEAELQQVFLNLLVNARDAMQGEGTLKVTTRRQERPHGEFAVIEIADTGRGMDEEVRQKIFEPFFSTKGEADGLGIGLYIVQRIVKNHSGFIEVESRKGEGSTFTISLPLTLVPTEKAVIEHVKREPSAFKKRKVLVVDDEEIVRDLLTGVLVPNGFEVLEASNGRTALELYALHGNTIDVIILDMVMPGMKGDSVLSALASKLGRTKTIISSGFMTEEQRERLEAFKIDAFLDKPYTDKEVLRVMALLFPEKID